MVSLLFYHLNEYDCWNVDSTNYTIHITLSNLTSSSYDLFLYQIDETHSNGYTMWKHLGEPTDPSHKELLQLQANDDLQLVTKVNNPEIHNGKMVYDVNIQSNSVVLLKLIKR